MAHGATKVFYYDCLPLRKPNESDIDYDNRAKPQEMHFQKLRSLHGWHVIEGIVKGSSKRPRQKEVDIQIAVDMLTHSYRRNMHRITFIAGDQDFRPLIEAVVREGMSVELWYEKSSASVDLAQSADARTLLDPFLLHGFLDKTYQRVHPFPHRVGTSTHEVPKAVVAEVGTPVTGAPIALFVRGGGQYLTE